MLAKPIITYMDAAKLDTVDAVKVAYVDSATKATVGRFESLTDPAEYEASDEKLSIVTTALDNGTYKNGVKVTGSTAHTNRLAVGINSNMLAVDFLRSPESRKPPCFSGCFFCLCRNLTVPNG